MLRQLQIDNYFTARNKSAKTPSPNPRKRAASVQVRLQSDSEEGTTDDDREEVKNKRLRLSTDPEPDLNRQIRSKEAFADVNNGLFTMVHAADIASSSKPTKFKPAFPGFLDDNFVSLQYPSASQMER